MLVALTTAAVAFAAAHREAAYALIALVAFSESLPVIGAIVPGDAVILAVSALVPTGALGLWPLIGCALVGAVLGDGFAFWLGRHYHAAVLGRWPLRDHPHLIVRGTTFQHRHGGKSVFVARFTPGVRAIVPVLAGILRMDAARFYAMNVLSAVLWAPAHILAGAAIGASFVLLGAVAGRLALITALLLVLLGVFYLAARYLVRRLPPLAVLAQERLRLWASARPGWLARQLLAVLDPSRREMPGLALLGGIVLLSSWLFIGVLQDVIVGDALVRANEAVFYFLQGLRTEWVDQVMVTLSELGDARVVVVVALAALAWLVWRRNWRAAAHLLAVVATVGLATVILKVSLQLYHPGPVGADWDAFAFPSGQSAANAALYGFLATIAAWELEARWRLSVTAALALVAVAIAFARVYLGVHWLSDVLAGSAFGLAVASLLAIAYLRHDPPPVGAGGLCVAVGLGLMMGGAAHVERWHATDMRRFAVRQRVRLEPLNEWWQHGWAQLPARRVDLIGGAEAPLTFQWAGRRTALRRELAAGGWSAPPAWTPRAAARWFDPRVALMQLPVLPHLNSGHREVLVRVHAAGRGRLVLRLWRSSMVLTKAEQPETPLYVGTVTEEYARRVAPLMTLTRQLRDYDGPRNVLAATLRARRLAARAGTPPDQSWDGCVLLAQAARAAVPSVATIQAVEAPCRSP